MNKTNQSILLAILILAALVLSACGTVVLQGNRNAVRGSGKVVEETRAVSGVTGVELATLGTLNIKVGDTESLLIKAEDNLMEHIETEVIGGKLRIGTPDNVNLDPKRSVKYTLTVTSLDTIVISSSGDIQAPDLEAGKFSITIRSSGNLEMGVLNADTLEVDISSSGNLDIGGGQVKTQNITINGSGKYKAKDLESEDAEVNINSSGSATIWVLDSLKANLGSSGDLRFRGNPTLDATANSSGKVIKID